jgi:choline kinase
LVISYDQEWLPLWRDRFADPLEDAETFRLRDNGALQSIGDHAAEVTDIEGQYMGLLKISPAGWRRIEVILDDLPKARRDRLDMTSLLQLLLEDGAEINATPTRGRWCEVDSETDLRLYENRLGRPNWEHDWRWETAVTA